jgi:hypothetical protein
MPRSGWRRKRHAPREAKVGAGDTAISAVVELTRPKADSIRSVDSIRRPVCAHCGHGDCSKAAVKDCHSDGYKPAFPKLTTRHCVTPKTCEPIG